MVEQLQNEHFTEFAPSAVSTSPSMEMQARIGDQGLNKCENLGHVALQTSIAYIVALLWFLNTPSGLWEDFLRHTVVGEYLAQDADMQPSKAIHHMETDLAFATVLAATHTILVFVGIALSGKVKRCFGGKPAGVIVLTMILGLFFVSLHHSLRYGFENKVDVVYSFASAFWNDCGADSFALTSAAATSLWFAAALTIPQVDHAVLHRGLVPMTYAQYCPQMALVYAACFAFFRLACGPVREVMNLFINPYALADDTGSLEILAFWASFTHASALALGVFFCALVNRWLARVIPTSPCNTPITDTLRNTLQDLVVLTFLIVAFGGAWTLFVTHDPLDFRSMELSAKIRYVLGGTQRIDLGICVSYSCFFTFGVLFEQAWHDSVTNKLYRPPCNMHFLAALPVPLVRTGTTILRTFRSFLRICYNIATSGDFRANQLLGLACLAQFAMVFAFQVINRQNRILFMTLPITGWIQTIIALLTYVSSPRTDAYAHAYDDKATGAAYIVSIKRRCSSDLWPFQSLFICFPVMHTNLVFFPIDVSSILLPHRSLCESFLNMSFRSSMSHGSMRDGNEHSLLVEHLYVIAGQASGYFIDCMLCLGHFGQDSESVWPLFRKLFIFRGLIITVGILLQTIKASKSICSDAVVVLYICVSPFLFACCVGLFYAMSETDFLWLRVLTIIGLAMNFVTRNGQVAWHRFMCAVCLTLWCVDRKVDSTPCALVVHVCTLPCTPPPCTADF